MPADTKGAQRESKVRVRAHFDYNPEVDPYIPCKEAGLAFQRGDVLHIVAQDDAYWWQARKDHERSARAGLIPSRALQERRILHERTQRESNDMDSKRKLALQRSPYITSCSAKSIKKKLKKRRGIPAFLERNQRLLVFRKT